MSLCDYKLIVLSECKYIKLLNGLTVLLQSVADDVQVEFAEFQLQAVSFWIFLEANGGSWPLSRSVRTLLPGAGVAGLGLGRFLQVDPPALPLAPYGLRSKRSSESPPRPRWPSSSIFPQLPQDTI